MWHSNSTTLFSHEADVLVGADGVFSITIEPSAITTVSSRVLVHEGGDALMARLGVQGGGGGGSGDGPDDAPFPLPYADAFDVYGNDSLPLYTSDMFGAFTTYALPPGTPHPPPSSSVALGWRELEGGGGGGGVATSDSGLQFHRPCVGEVEAAARPGRCVAAAVAPAAANFVLRQWVQEPPIGE